MHVSDDVYSRWAAGNTGATSIVNGILFARIAEAVAWCNRGDKTTDFNPAMRSAELMPPLLHAGRDAVVHHVGLLRARRVRNSVQPTPNAFPDLAEGRLMVYFPDADLCDGAAEAESDGFFDVFNTPPWDTWVAYFEENRPELQGLRRVSRRVRAAAFGAVCRRRNRGESGGVHLLVAEGRRASS